VWADEPTGALDSHTADEIIDLLRTLNLRNGLTVVVVTHDATVGARCDRIVNMRDGEIVHDRELARHLERFEPAMSSRELVAV